MQEFSLMARFSGFHNGIDHSLQLIDLIFRDARFRPLQSKRFELDSERMQMPHLLGGELRYVSACVRHSPHESLTLQADQSLPHHRRPNPHLPGEFTFHQSVAWLEISPQKRFFERIDHPASERNRLNLVKGRDGGRSCILTV